MKSKLTLLMLVLAQLNAAQLSDCADLDEKLNIHQLQINELSKQVNYYKTLLNATKAIRSSTYEDMQFNINQVIGSKKDGSIMMRFTYKNLKDETRRTLQCEKAVIIDTQGNQHQTNQVYLAPNSGKILANDVLKGIPYQGAMFFKKNTAYFPVIRALIVYVYPVDNLTNPKPVVFENLPVIWE